MKKKKQAKRKLIASGKQIRISDEAPRAIAIMFDCFESLHQRKCFCGSHAFRRVAASTRGQFSGEYSLTLACCMSCFRLYHLV